jgi:hypothetical protein
VPTGQPTDLTEAQVNIRLVTEGSKTTVTTNSIKAGAYRFKITNSADENDSVSSPTIDYIADVNTAKQEPLDVVSDNSLANSTRKNVIIAKVSDFYKNPVHNASLVTTVTSESNEAQFEVTTVPSNGTTDKQGELEIQVAATTTTPEDTRAEVTAEFTRHDGSADIKKTSISFRNTIIYPCADGTMNCIPVVQINSNQYFTVPATAKAVKNVTKLKVSGLGGSGDFGFAGFIDIDAGVYCDALRREKYNGFSDWRRPSRTEYNDYTIGYNRLLDAAEIRNELSAFVGGVENVVINDIRKVVTHVYALDKFGAPHGYAKATGGRGMAADEFIVGSMEMGDGQGDSVIIGFNAYPGSDFSLSRWGDMRRTVAFENNCGTNLRCYKEDPNSAKYPMLELELTNKSSPKWGRYLTPNSIQMQQLNIFSSPAYCISNGVR